MNKGITDLIPAAVEAIKQETIKKMELFGSVGKSVYSNLNIDEIISAVIKEIS